MTSGPGRDPRTRLAELGRLGRGWLDGQGEPVTAAALEGALAFVAVREDLAGTARPYPTVDGGVTFEFVAGPYDLSVEVGPDGSVELYGVRRDGPGEVDTVTAPSPEDPAFLAALDLHAPRRDGR